MKYGDRVIVTTEFNCLQMFYGKDEVPNEEHIPVGSHGTIESAWRSGAGIVKIDGGKSVLVMDLSSKFSPCIDPTEPPSAATAEREV